MAPRQPRPNRPRIALAALSLFALGSCHSDEPLQGAGPSVPQPLARPFVSSLAAPVGGRIAIAIEATPPGAVTLGSVSGVMHFDPTRLAYAGQDPYDSLAYPLVVVNDAHAGSGEVQVASLDPAGLSTRVAVLAFDVLAPDYTAGLSYTTDLAASLHLTIVGQGDHAEAAGVDSSLVPSGSARRLQAADWTRLGESRREASVIDAVPPGRRYGDVDGNGVISIVDALMVTQWMLGLSYPAGAPIPGPGDLPELAGNVSPANLRGLGEASDTMGPGWSSQCDRKWDVLDGLGVPQGLRGRGPSCRTGHPVGRGGPGDPRASASAGMRAGYIGSACRHKRFGGRPRYAAARQRTSGYAGPLRLRPGSGL